MSFTSSAHADDEQSSSSERDSTASSDDTMSDDGLHVRRYAGEDARKTSSKELAGWFTYAFAAEPFIICGAFTSYSLTQLPFLL